MLGELQRPQHTDHHEEHDLRSIQPSEHHHDCHNRHANRHAQDGAQDGVTTGAGVKSCKIANWLNSFPARAPFHMGKEADSLETQQTQKSTLSP